MDGKRCTVSLIFLLLGLAGTARAVAPGGVYSADESMTITLDGRPLPRTEGYRVVRGWALYHGRRLRFSSGVYLPRAFFHSSTPMPVLMTLHNRFGIGLEDGSGMTGEGMGRILHQGGHDDRAQGEGAQNPISLPDDAPFIGLVPQCPLNFGWESPPMAKMVCNFIAMVVSAYHADDDRVYLTGFSYGASSTWRVALLAPDRFAALIICDGRATPDPIHDVEKLKNVAVYLEVGQWDGEFVQEADRMHQALNLLPHRDYIFRVIPGGNHFCYQTVYDDPMVWKWVLSKRRSAAGKFEERKSNARNENE